MTRPSPLLERPQSTERGSVCHSPSNVYPGSKRSRYRPLILDHPKFQSRHPTPIQVRIYPFHPSRTSLDPPILDTGDTGKDRPVVLNVTPTTDEESPQPLFGKDPEEE